MVPQNFNMGYNFSKNIVSPFFKKHRLCFLVSLPFIDIIMSVDFICRTDGNKNVEDRYRRKRKTKKNNEKGILN
jgi:hypothetical protein